MTDDRKRVEDLAKRRPGHCTPDEWKWLLSRLKSLEEENAALRSIRQLLVSALCKACDQPDMEPTECYPMKMAVEHQERVEKLKVLKSAFYNLNDTFEDGEQPCKDFSPQRESNGYGEWDNRHSCLGCCGLRSFCINCSFDHHELGWENCANLVKQKLEARKETLAEEGKEKE